MHNPEVQESMVINTVHSQTTALQSSRLSMLVKV